MIKMLMLFLWQLQTIGTHLVQLWQCKLGKHVYLEKPCSHNLMENELVVAAQKKYNKVVQMGNQQRSSAQTIEIIKDIHNGIIGDAYKAIAFYTNGRGEYPVQ